MSEPRPTVRWTWARLIIYLVALNLSGLGLDSLHPPLIIGVPLAIVWFYALTCAMFGAIDILPHDHAR